MAKYGRPCYSKMLKYLPGRSITSCTDRIRKKSRDWPNQIQDAPDGIQNELSSAESSPPSAEEEPEWTSTQNSALARKLATHPDFPLTFTTDHSTSILAQLGRTPSKANLNKIKLLCARMKAHYDDDGGTEDDSESDRGQHSPIAVANTKVLADRSLL